MAIKKESNYLKMFTVAANISTAGTPGLSEDRIVEMFGGSDPTETEQVWLARALSESSLDVLTGLAWQHDVPPSRLTALFRMCHVFREDWDYA